MAGVGCDRVTGKRLDGWPHVIQSIGDILTTRVGTRVMRRPYGSDTPKLIDAPMTEQTLLAFYVSIATALALWEPRFELQDIRFADASASGAATLKLTGIYYPRGHLGDRTPDIGTDQSAAVLTLNEGLWQAVA